MAVLSDEGVRKAYDNVLKAKQAAQIRNRQLDEKRKKLKDDLDAREAAAADREQGISRTLLEARPFPLQSRDRREIS